MNENLTEFEKIILDKLKIGFLQSEIAIYLKENNVVPYSERSVEIRIHSLKKRFKCKTLAALIYTLTKKNLI